MSDPARVEALLSRFRNNPAGRVSPAFGTAHIRRALVELGDPQDRVPQAIHITGTNGKGSTGAFIRAMAEAAGLKVHVFTSPHLIRVNERIRVAGELVEDEVLADVLADIERRAPDLTYFEALTAAAFCLFAHVRADVSIVEVGAGGATDATNVMSRPSACVVTPISRDHEALFGVSGVAAIARLKAGIFREGVPAVLAEQPAIALGVLKEEARAAGLREAAWPARLQRLKPGPLAGGNGAAVVIDAAHNPGGAAALAQAIRDAAPEGGDRVALIIAIQAAKEVEGVLSELVPAVDMLVACPLPDSGGQEGGPGADPREIVGIATSLGGKARVAGDLAEAVVLAQRSADRVYICGSLYLCGAALRLNGEGVA